MGWLLTLLILTLAVQKVFDFMFSLCFFAIIFWVIRFLFRMFLFTYVP